MPPDAVKLQQTSLRISSAAAWCMLSCTVLLLLSVQLQLIAAQEDPVRGDPGREMSWRACSSEEQLINCGDIPLTPAYRSQRLTCCRQHQPARLQPAAQAAAATAATQRTALTGRIVRADLTGSELLKTQAPVFTSTWARGLNNLTADIPSFKLASNGAYSDVAVASYTVTELTRSVIQQVKNASMFSTGMPPEVREYHEQMKSVNTVNGMSFNHPGTGAGPAELALLRYRVRTSFPVQSAARDSLVTGTGVKPKIYVTSSGTWSPPTDCQPTGYYGPLAMPSVQIQYSGFNAPGIPCPANYPAAAPQDICGHVSFVELDGQMAYKMALAFHATGDTRYSDQVVNIASSWSSSNLDWGSALENGPLEAAWGIAAMSRALELVRNRAPPGLIQQFTTWVMGPPVKDNIVYNMEYYINLTKTQNRPNIYGNWRTSLTEAYMAVGVLSDNITTYNRGVDLFTVTLSHYLKWGKGLYAAGRVLGECSETLRDMYHAQFGLGGLLQAAEIAWQQDDASLYAQDNFALTAAMELHARFTNAYLGGKSVAMLPEGYRFYDSGTFPKPLADSSWKFNMEKQLWSEYWTINGSYTGYDLTDGDKYVLGSGFLPTGWEVGYNHYAGRLGLPMPETAALLSRMWPEWQEFHWGLGTLSHAQSAQQLWRNGLDANVTLNTTSKNDSRCLLPMQLLMWWCLVALAATTW